MISYDVDAHKVERMIVKMENELYEIYAGEKECNVFKLVKKEDKLYKLREAFDNWMFGSIVGTREMNILHDAAATYDMRY